MPPKKRVSEARGTEDDSVLKESLDDYLLPRTMIGRLAKGVLPPNTQLQKDALTAILKSTTVFVNYLANNANDTAVLGNHKTIKPEDVFLALQEMEFEHMIPRVTAEQERYVDIQNTKRNDYRHRIKDGKDAPDAEGDSTAVQGEDGLDVTASDGPATKKAKLSLANGNGAKTTTGDSGDEEEDDKAGGEGHEDEDDEAVEDEEEDESQDDVDELEDDEPEEFADAVQDLHRNDNLEGDTESDEDD